MKHLCDVNTAMFELTTTAHCLTRSLTVTGLFTLKIVLIEHG